MRAVESPTNLWLRGLLDVCLLAALEHGPLYGYEMTKRLADAGLDVVADGSIYPALARMQKAGLVTAYREPSAEGPPRKYYRVSKAGAALLVRRREQWDEFSGAVTKVLNQGDQ
jgi:PadR family transcriptional regulator PadR